MATKTKEPPTQDDVNLYLDKLRNSGETNMFGAAPYIRKRFECSTSDARKFLGEWMRTYSTRHP